MIIDIEARDAIPAVKLFAEFIPVKSRSDSAPTLILAPGGPGASHAIYKEQIDFFSTFGNVVIFDPRGCGESSITGAAEYHMSVYVDDIEALRRFFKLDHFILLGTSYGAMVAQGYAIRYGSALSGLILVAGAPSYEFIDRAVKSLETCGTIAQREMFARLLNGLLESDDALRQYFEVMAPLYTLKTQTVAVKPEATGETEFHAAKKTVRYNSEAALAGFGPGGFLRTFDWRPQLSVISCPMRIIVGEKDWINEPSLSIETQSLIRNCKLEIVPQSSHFLWVDQKERYFEIVTDFLLEISAICSCLKESDGPSLSL